MKYPDIYRFKADQDGAALLIFGAIHGNEVCGTKALLRLKNEIETGELILKSGQLIFVPICNPQAYEEQTRDIDVNLNRIFYHHDTPTLYEHFIANHLVPLINEADILLDIHSYTSDNKPFAIQKYDSKEHDRLTSAVPLTYVLKDWLDLYKDRDDKNAHTTNVEANSKGVAAITVECGLHDSESSVDVAYTVIRSVLAEYGIIDGAIEKKTQKLVSFKQVFFFEEGAKYTKPYKHLDCVEKDELIAIYPSGQEVHAKSEGYILLPNMGYYDGAEWFYLGKDRV